MKINYKNFLIGMFLAMGPTFIWAQSKLNPSYKANELVETKTEMVEADFVEYAYFVVQPNNDGEVLSVSIESTPEPTATPIPTQMPRYIKQVASQERLRPTPVPIAPEGINELIDLYAEQYGADPNMMKKIAKCESGYNAAALSPSGAYAGMYQFVTSTWISNRNAMGMDPNPELRYNAEEAIRTAAFKMGRDGYGAWPVCSRI